MTNKNAFYLIGYASGIAGVDSHAGDGPTVLQQSPIFTDLIKHGLPIEWYDILKPVTDSELSTQDVIRDICTSLAKNVSTLVKSKKPLCVIGGDHTSAIGTWSGVYDAIHDKGDMGLIWIDAHMDSHTPQTSESGRIHGMPVACLLGEGYSTLTAILHGHPKVKPEHLCLIGVRSYESGEAELLNRLGVKVYLIEEVNRRGYDAVWDEAVAQVSKGTYGYGVTLDIDAIDPTEAPAVDVPEPGGLSVSDIAIGLSKIAADPRLLATEIVEFDPSRDQENKTEKLIYSLIKVLAATK